MNSSRHETHYRPISLIDSLLNQDVDRLFGAAHGDENPTVTRWKPAIDIEESAEQFELSADLPGVKPADIDITAEDGVLTIQGQRETKVPENKQGYQHLERVSGNFLRRFKLPDTANLEQISAQTDNGVLKVTIAKQVKAKARKIAVATA
jgi:HSP20 family protein